MILVDHQILHLFIGLLFCPGLQLNALENSKLFEITPSTLF